MDNLSFDVESARFDNASRHERWNALRSHLKQLVRIADENSDRLALLEQEVKEARNHNLQLTEWLQVLCDLTNGEVQREVSLTLNDTDFNVVVDTDEDDAKPQKQLEPHASDLSEARFLAELKKFPGVGDKSAQSIADYIAKAHDETVLDFARVLMGVNADIAGLSETHQSILPFEQ